MKIVIPGGSGQVGTILARAFHRGGHDVAVLSRQPQPSPWRVLEWDGATLGNWQREIDGCDVVINLAGRSADFRPLIATAASHRTYPVSQSFASWNHLVRFCRLQNAAPKVVERRRLTTQTHPQ